MDKDEEIRKQDRKAYDKFIWIKGERARVESRQTVINQYVAWVKEYKKEDLVVPVDEGEPESESTSVQTDKDGKRRRSFNVGKAGGSARKRTRKS